MKLFCLCETNGGNYEVDAYPIKGVVLGNQMDRTNGVKQVIDLNPLGTPVFKEHHPSIDKFECKSCGKTIICEG